MINLDGISPAQRKKLYGNKTIVQIDKPSESEEQQNIFAWAEFMSAKYPELQLLYHIPNEGKRTKSTGGKLKREGLRSGVPDICLPIARAGYNSLYIELKAVGGKVTKNQEQWIKMLNDYGNLAVVCYGFDDAVTVIENYIRSVK